MCDALNVPIGLIAWLWWLNRRLAREFQTRWDVIWSWGSIEWAQCARWGSVFLPSVLYLPASKSAQVRPVPFGNSLEDMSLAGPRGLTFLRWGCYGLSLTKTNQACLLVFIKQNSVLVSISVFMAFNCILFHKFSRQLCVFSLCSSGLISAFLVLSTIIISLYESLIQPWYNP